MSDDLSDMLWQYQQSLNRVYEKIHGIKDVVDLPDPSHLKDTYAPIPMAKIVHTRR